MCLAELFPQFLRPVCGQAVVCSVPWVKAEVCILNFLVSPHVLDSYRPAQKMAALAKEFSQQGKPTEKSSA
jgi:hypothetical protein